MELQQGDMFTTKCRWLSEQKQQEEIYYIDKTGLTLSEAQARINELKCREAHYSTIEERPIRWEYWYEREEMPCLSSKESPGSSGW